MFVVTVNMIKHGIHLLNILKLSEKEMISISSCDYHSCFLCFLSCYVCYGISHQIHSMLLMFC